MIRRTILALPLAALLLCGCAAVAVRPEGDLPKALIVPTPAKVAVVVTPEAANYVHKESRASVDYEAQLGPSHRHIVEEIFRAEFREAKFFEDLDAARKEPGVHAIFEPRIEQFSSRAALHGRLERHRARAGRAEEKANADAQV